MTQVRRLLPDPGFIDVSAVAVQRLRPFSEQAATFGQALSDALMGDPALRGDAQAMAVAFALRRTAAEALRKRAAAEMPDRCTAAPRGTVLLFAPANVDALFLYCWFWSLLCGNGTIIRLSARSTPLRDALIDHVAAVLDDPAHGAVRAAVQILTWGHEPEIAAALSATCDLRMIWGGDPAVRAVRAAPLAPQAVDLAFADRSSLAMVRASAYAAADESGRDDIARRIAADSYPFDQAACSSPGLLIWIGDAETCRAAADDFLPRLGRAGTAPSDSLAAAKLTEAARLVLDGAGERVRRSGAALVVDAAFDAARAGACGGGLFVQTRASTAADAAAILTKRHQTLTHYGFSRDEVADLAARLNGRAVDRFVPIGRALDFQAVWDGTDMLKVLLRFVRVEI